MEKRIVQQILNQTKGNHAEAMQMINNIGKQLTTNGSAIMMDALKNK